MRILIEKATKRIWRASSAAREGTLLDDWILNGGDPEAAEEREVDQAGYEAAKAEDPVYIAEKNAAAEGLAAMAAKEKEIVENLPSWKEVSEAIDGVTTIAGLKVVVKKLARVVYWLAKNKAE